MEIKRFIRGSYHEFVIDFFLYLSRNFDDNISIPQIGGSVLGAIVLPLVGFGIGGIAAGSTAAAWQSSIGSAGIVASGSLFAILQSLGSNGLGIILFGSVGAALGLLSATAAKIGWCLPKMKPKRHPRSVENQNENEIEGSCMDEMKVQ